MESPRVTIVVLNWNGREDSLACLRSLERLQYPHHRVLFVDNGSVDGSEDAVAEEFPGVGRLQTGANLGFAGGNNAGIAWALERDADFVLLLNNDTEVEADFLGPMVAAAQADPRVGIVGAAIAYHHAPDRLWAFGGGRFDVATGWVRHVQREVDPATLGTRGTVHYYITGCAMLLRRSVIEEIGVLDTSYFHFCEDVDLCLRAEAAGWRVTVAPEARLRHKVSATTRVSSPAFLYYNLRSRLTLARRHGPAGSPSRLAVAKLWLRLWRPAVQSGLARSGWRALARAHADYRRGETGPVPPEIVGKGVRS